MSIGPAKQFFQTLLQGHQPKKPYQSFKLHQEVNVTVEPCFAAGN
jgi:hypothetical protein